MKKNGPNPKVDWYFTKAESWKAESEKLRAIVLACGLTEELKWGHPCYTYDGANVVLIHGFKAYCGLLFMKGALLKDPRHILITQTKNVQSGRQIRFTNVREIVKLVPTLKAYIKEAIEVEKSGAQITYKKTADFEVVEEFRSKLDQNSGLRAAFEALTPGRQRGYLLYFAGAKQSKTREARIEKCIPLIFDGIGLHD